MLRLLTSILAIIATASVLSAQKYPIRLGRPGHVGDKYSFSVSGTRVQQMSMMKGGQVLQSQMEEFEVTLDGVAELLEVDQKGEAIRQAFTVSKFTKTEKGTATELLMPGTVVIEDNRLEKNRQVFLKDGNIEETVRAAFEMVSPTHQKDSPTDDELFGTNEPRAVGESWPINRQLSAQNLKSDGGGLTVPPEHLSGNVSLVGKEKLEGVDCLKVSAEMKADALNIDALPATTSIDQGIMNATFGGCYPLTDTDVPRRQSMVFNAQMRLKGNTGTPAEGVTFEMKFSEKAEFIARAFAK